MNITTDLTEAIAAFTQGNPLKPMLERRATWHSQGKKGELHGPCPVCGGEDRCMFWPQRRRAYCRQCRRAGDALDWAMHLDGHDPKPKGARGAYLTQKGYLKPPETPLRRAGTQKAAAGTSPINLGAIDPLRAYYADFLRERRAVLVVDGGLTPRAANIEARRLLKTIRERERHAQRV